MLGGFLWDSIIKASGDCWILTSQVSSLLDEKLRYELVEDVAEEYEEIREEYYESLKVLILLYPFSSHHLVDFA